MMQYGDRTKIPQLKKLWKACFADEDAYIHDFFEAMYENEHVLLEEEKGVLIGASFFLPGKIWMERPDTDDAWQPIRYVYALAVRPQFRGRGVGAGLLRRAHELYDAPLIAEPAEEGLIGGFYEPLGFTSDFYIKKSTMELPRYDLRAAQAEEWEWIPASPAEYLTIRDSRFRRNGYVSWPLPHVAFALRQHGSSGGGAYILRMAGREELLLYFIENQTVIVTETTLCEEECMELLTPHVAGTCDKMIVTGQTADSTDRLIGMSYGLFSHNGNGYLNLSLD